MAEPVFNRLCLIGLGLIGSSIARLARERGDIAHTLVACDTGVGVAARVKQLGLADVVEVEATRAVEGCDGVLLCTPVGTFGRVMAQIAPHLAPGAVLSDVGSTKGSVLRDLLPRLPEGVHLVPGHPMAGTEHSGPDAGFATLFQGRYTILTPPEGADPAAVEKIAELWRRAGAMIETMDAATHDKVVAIVSHLPHLIAFTICSTADDLAQETREQVLKFAASGFRDFTRIAASDVDMWRDVFLNNREALLEMLARFSEDAHALGRAVRWGQAEFIEDRIRRGRKIRHGLIERKQA
ncbi:prephenate/arogenate dehydrogenase family protein [Roseomonas sp. E05]|uniref:prephenate/arogenate dehydrogenase family protein n=1 Tax=Roseomonas sp. E05 TaxID=3046310 RepID=UPI0024B8F815|nr:prephenate/arogenate dehydrogenase family protein [Roseomonas sp. E05]MDJ0390119.1 prephenate/arogenate dehydrogenase family protein [Roseomonas sp. E05]